MSIESKSLSDSLCYKDESFYNSYLISEIEAKDANIKVVCERGDVKEIYQVIDKDKVLLFSNPGLYKILRAAQEEEATKRYAKLTSLAESIDKAEDEIEIKRLGRQYRKEIDSYKSEFLEPLTKELGNLIELLETTDDEDKKLRLEEEIAQVKEMIGYYSNLENDSDFNIKQTVKKLLSVGETKTANEIAEAQLLSSKLSVDSIESTSDFNETLVTVSKDLKKFKKDISEVSRDSTW